eukprot:7105288-Pyramimonas_sp.AAC.1
MIGFFIVSRVLTYGAQTCRVDLAARAPPHRPVDLDIVEDTPGLNVLKLCKYRKLGALQPAGPNPGPPDDQAFLDSHQGPWRNTRLNQDCYTLPSPNELK